MRPDLVAQDLTRKNVDAVMLDHHASDPLIVERSVALMKVDQVLAAEVAKP